MKIIGLLKIKLGIRSELLLIPSRAGMRCQRENNARTRVINGAADGLEVGEGGEL